MELSETQIHRYARHIILPEIGGLGQERLLSVRVLIIGAGGLGTPLVQYLAAAGIGTLGIADDDTVDLSNLQRQVMHRSQDIGMAKVESARHAAEAINPDCKVVPHRLRVSPENVADLVAQYDIVADGSDNFATRYLMNDACYLGRRTLVSAAILRFDGQLSTFKAYHGAPHPCYRCLFAAPPPADAVPSCAQAGVLGAMAGTMGALQAGEIIKEVLGVGDSLSGTLLLHDALAARFDRLSISRNPACALCGEAATIHDLNAPAARASYGAVDAG